MLVAAVALSPWSSPAVAEADEIRTAVGVVDQVQLIDASSIGGRQQLVVRLDDGQAFRVPHRDHLAAGRGVRVELKYRRAPETDELPIVCSTQVLALPNGDDENPGLQPVKRSFEVYRNPDCPPAAEEP